MKLRKRSPHRTGSIFAALVFFLGLGVSAAGALWLYRANVAQTQSLFHQRAVQLSEEVHARFELPLFALNGIRGIFSASHRVSRAEFRAYVNSHDLAEEFKGIRGIGFLQPVERSALDTFIATQLAEEQTQYEIHTPVGVKATDRQHSDLYIVKSFEPDEELSGLEGMDVGAHPVLRAAILRSIQSGRPVYTNNVMQAGSSARSESLLLVEPVFLPDAKLDTPQARQSALYGLVFTPVSLPRLLEHTHSMADGELSMELFDAAHSTKDGTLLYNSAVTGRQLALNQNTHKAPSYGTTQAMILPGRELTLRVSSTPAFEAANASNAHWIFFMVAGLISTLIAALLRQQDAARHHAENMVKSTTLEIDRLAQVVRHTASAVVITDRESRINWVNQGFTRLSGYTIDEARGKTTVELIGSDVNDPTVMARLAEAATTDTVGRGKLLHRAKDGREYWLDTEVLPLHDEQGQWIGAMEISTDITALILANEAAKSASNAKSQFLANMSHEIRTPMNAILGMLKLLQTTGLTTRQLDYASKADGAAKSLLGLLNEILDLSKIEAGKIVLDPHPFDMERLLRDLSVLLGTCVGKKPVEILFDIDPALPKTFVGDAMRLQQVLINLSGNAIKFTTRGEVVVQIKIISQVGLNTSLLFAVRDSGIGIAPENFKNIFNSFSQADQSISRRFGGTGLGLSISQQLVNLMGGKLEFDSTVGVGSTFYFTITLPVSQTGSGETNSQEAARQEPLSVLVIEDNAAARQLLMSTVQSWGWPADAAHSGQHAIDMVKARAAADKPAYQVLIVDWMMPGLDGWETLDVIRKLYANDSTKPVSVMISAHGREMLSLRTFEEQSTLDAFLVKPVTPQMMLKVIMDGRAGHSNVRARPRATLSQTNALKGMRILVVEDNVVNQQVAQELLTVQGADVEIAGDGQAGVDAIKQAKEPFDAVLMDVQMPVMDGYAATSVIRNELGMLNLPIIAMTANAMGSDRDACLAAGMNDHVGKPFDLAHLVRVLATHVALRMPHNSVDD